MKKLAMILVVILVFSLVGCGYEQATVCEHEFGEWKVTKKATSLEEGTQTRTCSKCGKVEYKSIPESRVEYGERLSDSEMKDKAKSYVESRLSVAKTTEGYSVTEYTIGTIEYFGKDTKDIYTHYTVYVSYSYRGTDKYGQTVQGKNTATYHVKVYHWSKNPDGYDVTGWL